MPHKHRALPAPFPPMTPLPPQRLCNAPTTPQLRPPQRPGVSRVAPAGGGPRQGAGLRDRCLLGTAEPDQTDGSGHRAVQPPGVSCSDTPGLAALDDRH